MKTVFVLLLVLLCTKCLCAEEWVMLTPEVDANGNYVTQRLTPSKREMALASALLEGATAFDIESTFFKLDQCDRCHELNFVMRPIVERGKLLTYVVVSGANSFALWNFSHIHSRKARWLSLSAVIGVHIVFGVINYKTAN